MWPPLFSLFYKKGAVMEKLVVVFSVILKDENKDYMVEKCRIGPKYLYGDALMKFKIKGYYVGNKFADYLKRCEKFEEMLKSVAEVLGFEGLMGAIRTAVVNIDGVGGVELELMEIKKEDGFMILRFFEK